MLIFPLAARQEPVHGDRVLKVRVTDQRLVIVPVRINGRGPFSFLLDTGSSATVVKPELVSKLQGKPIGTSAFLAGVQTRQVIWYRFDSLGLEGVEIGPVGVIGFSLDNHKALNVDGILGQDILHHYNYLLDYKKKVIAVDEDDSLATSLSSATVPLVEAKDRLVIEVTPKSQRKKKSLFILDSGANCLVVFRQDYEDYGLDVSLRVGTEAQTAAGGALVKTGVVRSFRIGDKEVSDIPVAFVPITSYTANRPELGTFPLNCFESVYINHERNIVAFEPQYNLSRAQPVVLGKAARKSRVIFDRMIRSQVNPRARPGESQSLAVPGIRSLDKSWSLRESSSPSSLGGYRTTPA